MWAADVSFHIALADAAFSGETLCTVFPLNLGPSGHLACVLYFKGYKWTFLKARLIKVPLDSREHKETNIKTICMYVGKTYLAWADFVRFQGVSLMDGHLLRGKIQAWGSVQILVIHASTYCSMRKKQPLIVFDRFFFFFFNPSELSSPLIEIMIRSFVFFSEVSLEIKALLCHDLRSVVIYREAVRPETNAALVFFSRWGQLTVY